MPIIVVTGKEIEKIKGDFESYLNGLNMVGEISYSLYSELYDEGTKQIQKAYELGKSELEKENAELKKQLTELKEFYEIEYFQIADRTADEKIKELEEHQVEVTVDDYSPYDENTWGDMHEEWFVPKELVRDLLKENYALLIKVKDLLKQWLQTSKASSCDNINIVTDTEQFLKEDSISEHIQRAKYNYID